MNEFDQNKMQSQSCLRVRRIIKSEIAINTKKV